MKPADKYASAGDCPLHRERCHIIPQIYQSIVRNYARKVVNKTFRREPAIRGVVNLVTAGLVKYRKEMGLTAPGNMASVMASSAATKEAAGLDFCSVE